MKTTETTEYKEALRNSFTSMKRLVPNSFDEELRGLFVQCIYTFEYGQEMIELPMIESVLSDEKTMTEFLTNFLTTDQYNKLIKISTCVYNAQLMKHEPAWFKNCNGKFYFNDEKYR